MSSRRNFLKNFGGLIGVSLFSPSILKALDRSANTPSTLKLEDKTTVKVLNSSLDHLNAEDRELTEQFINYLKSHNVGFKWERVYSSVFKTNDGKIHQTWLKATNAEYNIFWKMVKEEPKDIPLSATGFTRTWFCPKTEEEYRDMLFLKIASDIRTGLDIYNRDRIYLYHLGFTPFIDARGNVEKRRITINYY